MNTIDNLVTQLRSSNINDTNLRNKVRDKIKAVEERILPRNTELSKILNSISDKEKRFEDTNM